MRALAILKLAGSLLLATGASMLMWSFLPARQVEHTLLFRPEQVQAPEIAPLPALEGGTLTLRYPAVLRAGDPAWARLVFQPLPSADEPGPGAEEPPQMTTVFVETRLELPGLSIQPAGGAGQALTPGRAVTFWWQLTGDRPGEYEGTAWLALRYESQADGRAQTIVLAAPRVRLRVERFILFTGEAARWCGGIIAALGAATLLWRQKHA